MINVYYVGPTRLLGLLLIYSKHIVSGIFVPNLWKDGQIFLRTFLFFFTSTFLQNHRLQK